MNPDPLGPVAEGFRSTIQQYRRDSERTRSEWNDQTRKVFDERHAATIENEMHRAFQAMEAARDALRSAVALTLSASQQV